MTQQTKIKAAFEPAKVAAHTGVGASYAALGSAFSEAAQILIISSSLVDGSGDGVSAWLSTDGTDDHLLVLGVSTVEINVSSNKQSTSQLAFPKETQLYIKQGPDGAPAGGDISVSLIYGR